MLKPIFIIIIILFIFKQNCVSQIQAQYAEGITGDEIQIIITVPVSFATIGINALEGKIHLSNPTVFYPDSITNLSGFIMTPDITQNIHDSAWIFKTEFEKSNSNDSLIYLMLYGEALAGTDSTCFLKFTGIKLNEISVNDFTTKVTIHRGSIPSNYIRFAKIIKYYPNPVEDERPTKWYYLIDKSTIVEFYIIDYRGKETFLVNLGEKSIGIHEFDFTPEMGFSSGWYWMKLKTTIGESISPFVIAR
ncbi:MAG: hypothetical protein HZB41_08815 [Ignavibacteriae bacterium]|nr:hypothetical protein [Ignavibacteriota bacterium]